MLNNHFYPDNSDLENVLKSSECIVMPTERMQHDLYTS